MKKFEKVNPVISIIVPVFNSEKYLLECLDSLVNQSLKNIEIILVNDGSSDSSPEICNKYAEKDSRITVIHKKNSGVSDTRNAGISCSKGEFIMFVDSDDWINLNTCEVIYKTIIEKKADFLIFSHTDESSSGSIVKEIFKEDEIIFNKNEVYEHLFKGVIGLTKEKLKMPEKVDSLVPVWARLYRKSIIENNKILNVDLSVVPSECQLFNMEFLYYVNKAVYIKKPLYHYRRNNASSITSIGYRDQLLEKWEYWSIYVSDYFKKINAEQDLWEVYYSRLCLSMIPLGGNAVNKETIGLQLKEIRTILNASYLDNAFVKTNFSNSPFYWRTFFLFIKKKNVLGFYVLTKLMREILRRRKK